MRYKTTIEVFTEAEDKREAIDIAGEYLRGALEADAQIRVRAIPIRWALSLRLLGVVLCIGILAMVYFVGNRGSDYRLARTKKESVTSYAVHPPLKIGTEEFREAWEKEEREVVNSYAR